MQHDKLVPPEGLPRPTGPAALRDLALLWLIGRWLPRLGDWRLRVTMPSGRARVLGDGPHEVTLDVKSFALAWNAIRRGQLGFAESLISGHVTANNLGDVFRFAIDNGDVLDRAGSGLFRSRGADLAYHRGRANTRAGSRANIAAHYDLGNAFYRLWLDRGMTYSSGIFRSPSSTLDEAQAEKYRAVLDALELGAGHRVLEIGCGWGGFAEAAARSGADVRAITLSARQLDYARRRLARAGLASRTAFALEDYRDTADRYDRIASIEMIEAVGEEHWPRYFETLDDRLVPGGIAVIQAITIREECFDAYRARPDFIQRYIFPGGMLPTPTAIVQNAAAAGLAVEPLERFGQSYARTLQIWRSAFHAAWPQIAALGFDDRFRRLWDYYLTYCEVGFEKGVIDVGLYRFRKPASPNTPL